MGTEYQYTGQYRQPVLGLDYYGARWYDSYLNRWTSPDTIIPDPNNPQAYDRYAYTCNNPVRYRDPDGHWIESAIDIAFIAYDIYDVSQNGLNWENGLSLAADVAGLLLPAVTGGGLLVRAAAHGDDAVRATDRIVSLSDEAIAFGEKLVDNLPEETHHLASNINKKWTPIFESITAKYGNLNDLWNKVEMPHKGRHPDAYHEWMRSALNAIDAAAQGNPTEFRGLFEKYVTNVVKQNPWILRSSWWKKYGNEWWRWWDDLVEQGLE